MTPRTEVTKLRKTSLIEHFANIEDPRQHQVDHLLIDVLTIAICGVICGADNWVEIEQFGQAKKKWFGQFLRLLNGIPSHDTFGRVFAAIEPGQFQQSFINWIQAVTDLTAGEVVPIDGKQLRGSYDKANGKAAIYMVSAWASQNNLVLGQVKVDDKSNEITAMPQLLQLLELTGCIVTTDAMGCQAKIAELIIERGADYVLALKQNHPGTYDDVHSLFSYALEQGGVDCDYHQTIDKGHGRLEIRHCWTLSDPEYLIYLRNRSKWLGLQTLVMVRSERTVDGQTSSEIRYFLSSLAADAHQHLQVVRSHWHIENKCHWILDVAFREDLARIRQGNADQNFSVLRHIALNLLKQEHSAKCGVKAKRLKAGWDENYLLKLLSLLT